MVLFTASLMHYYYYYYYYYNSLRELPHPSLVVYNVTTHVDPVPLVPIAVVVHGTHIKYVDVPLLHDSNQEELHRYSNPRRPTYV
jgi:hypothetical protein